MRITLIRAWPGQFEQLELELTAPATVADALAQADWNADALAIFGVRAAPQDPVRDGDRIELLRPLVADPKQARRARADARLESSRRVQQRSVGDGQES